MTAKGLNSMMLVAPMNKLTLLDLSKLIIKGEAITMSAVKALNC